MLGLASQDRMDRNFESENAARNRTIDLGERRLNLDTERANQLKYIKSGTGAYSFNPETGEVEQVITPTTNTPKSNGEFLLKQRNSLLDQMKVTAPEDKDTLMELKVRLNNIDGKLNKVGQASPVALNAPPTLQPSLPTQSGPKVGETVPGGVWGGGGVIPVGAGVPTAPTALQPTVTPPIKPSRQDVEYLASHPEKKSAFEARFGAGSADLYLP
jgi:hypothetical protein